ncbi:hypothetical protein G2W53_005769 [Senna tora]|uniref:Uncharacterized protein n=1 Tax=Senna tora TaxID=362788 RepID=A0A835CFV2_9FABA|nr:hypothetical protein G2W53_005769 [Senna tora]
MVGAEYPWTITMESLRKALLKFSGDFKGHIKFRKQLTLFLGNIIISNKSSSVELLDQMGRGIYILYEDVKSCPYEDVHVLWSILVESHAPSLPLKE